MESYRRLLKNNQIWAENCVDWDPEFFSRLSKLQEPEFLWIGCSDSRVPSNEITGTRPGEIFVHRNIANMVVNTDLNLLSVLQFAVEMLNVKHIIVCGHYGCGGVKAAMGHDDLGIINKWLYNIKDVRRMHAAELEAIPSEDKRFDRLVELNVMEQVKDLAKSSIVQRAWAERGGPHLHGWVYGLNDGLIRPLCEIEAGSEMDPIYRFDGFVKVER